MAVEAKAEVAIDSLSTSEAQDIFKLFGYDPESAERLYGGYSSSNFKVVGRRKGEESSKTLLLKINYYGLTAEDAAYQIFVMEYLRSSSFPTNYPNAATDGSFVVEHDGRRAMLLDYVDGAVPGAKALATREARASDILQELAATLGRLHQVSWPDDFQMMDGSKMRDIYVGFPVCNTGDLLRGDDLVKLEADERFSTHALVKFLRDNYASSHDLFKRELPWGVIHGDAFLDNTLYRISQREDDSEEEVCKLAALIDWEDSCVGPLVLDLAVCVSACCFTAENEFIADRMRFLLRAYISQRPLSPSERESFIDFMMFGALACAFYRFCEFNVRQPESDSTAKDSYLLMFQRAQLLTQVQSSSETPTLIQAISSVLDECLGKSTSS